MQEWGLLKNIYLYDIQFENVSSVIRWRSDIIDTRKFTFFYSKNVFYGGINIVHKNVHLFNIASNFDPFKNHLMAVFELELVQVFSKFQITKVDAWKLKMKFVYIRNFGQSIFSIGTLLCRITVLHAY